MGTVKEVGYSKQVRYGKKGGVKIKKSITGKVCLSVCALIWVLLEDTLLYLNKIPLCQGRILTQRNHKMVSIH